MEIGLSFPKIMSYATPPKINKQKLDLETDIALFTEMKNGSHR